MSNCYKCEFRGTVPGSAHSSCNVVKHILEGVDEGRIASLELALMVGKASLENNGEEAVKRDPHGVKNGWANWPLDFDPVWIDCSLFTDEIPYAEEVKDDE